MAIGGSIFIVILVIIQKLKYEDIGVWYDAWLECVIINV